MRSLKFVIVALPLAALCIGCSKSSETTPNTKPATGAAATESAVHSHGTGPNGGVVFDLGAYHAEFLVDHPKHECKVVLLGADEKTPAAAAATELVLVTKATKTADGTSVAPMTIVLLPADATAGKASAFVGTDPGIANVADFAGTVTGEIDGKPASGDFDESAAGHGHAHTPHDGMVAKLMDEAGAAVGFVELKLHDDKGDLELWLAKDQGITQPMDLPADSEIEVTFLDFGNKSAILGVRNASENEDEDGKPNMRNGMTNYFIFPGDSGQDPTWLMGADFKSAVKLSFSANGKTYTSEEFVLVPHTHADGHGHTH